MKNFKNKNSSQTRKSNNNKFNSVKPKPQERKKYFEKDEDSSLQIEGRNSVLAAINSDKYIDKIFIKKGENEGSIKVIIAKALEKGILVQEVDKNKLNQISKSHNNQGIIAVCPAHEYCSVQDILKKAEEKNEDPFIIILDEITDPHNLGAIIRTSLAAGAHGVIIPKRRAVGLTAVVSKTASGALEHVPVARVSNIAREIERLKERGIWVACADLKGTEYFNADLKGPIAIVIGSEGQGIGKLIKKTCDFSVKIPIIGNIDSLNASVAASLVMYEVVRQRKFI